MGLELIEVFPNPFIEQTKISFLLKRPQNIQLEIFNNIGQKITTLAQGEYSEGLHQITFIPDNLSDGIYYYKLIIGNKHQYTTLSNALILAK